MGAADVFHNGTQGLLYGQLFLVTGSPGGSTIPTTVLQVMTHISDRNMTVAQAFSHPAFITKDYPT